MCTSYAAVNHFYILKATQILRHVSDKNQEAFNVKCASTLKALFPPPLQSPPPLPLKREKLLDQMPRNNDEEKRKGENMPEK